jgi:hypothetical protein
MTTIGFAPGALIECGLPVGLTGQFAQLSEPQSRYAPNRGDSAVYFAASALPSATDLMS